MTAAKPISPASDSDWPLDDADWPPIDAALLTGGRRDVPTFPLEVLPPAWRAWVADRARGLSAPVDYAAQCLLGAVSGTCGAGVELRITPEWTEPLVLWQALIGPSSSGKSAVLERLREILGTIEAAVRRSHGEPEDGPSCIAVDTPTLGDIAPVVAANPRGVVLWRDHPSAWLRTLGEDADGCAAWRRAWSARRFTTPPAEDDAPPLRLERFAVGILGTLEPEHLTELDLADGGLASRFLYAWPDAAPFCPFAERRQSKADDSVRMLLRIEEQARQSSGPLALAFESSALDSLETFLARLHRETSDAEGLEAAWLGKGPANTVRLAAALHLLGWSEDATRPPGAIDRSTLQAAVTLWNDYFRPHALAVINRAGPNELERHTRRVLRWLKASRHRTVSGREVRCAALGRTVNAGQTADVMDRLRNAGVVRPMSSARIGAGRPPEHWEINPAILPA